VALLKDTEGRGSESAASKFEFQRESLVRTRRYRKMMVPAIPETRAKRSGSHTQALQLALAPALAHRDLDSIVAMYDSFMPPLRSATCWAFGAPIIIILYFL
jgi:hypothetical protein